MGSEQVAVVVARGVVELLRRIAAEGIAGGEHVVERHETVEVVVLDGADDIRRAFSRSRLRRRRG